MSTVSLQKVQVQALVAPIMLFLTPCCVHVYEIEQGIKVLHIS